MFLLIRLLVDPALADAIVGDLEEQRHARAKDAPIRAWLWLLRTTVGLTIYFAVRAAADALRELTRNHVRTLRVLRDWRHALRTLRRTPWYTTTAIGVVTLSMALAVTIVAIVDGVLFKTLDYVDPNTLYEVSGGFSARPDVPATAVSVPDAVAWAAALPEASFAMAAIGGAVPIADNDELRSADIDARFLDVLGVRPALGGFSPADFESSAKVRPVLLTHQSWQQRFLGTPDIIGRTLVDTTGRGIRVVGILPRGFVYPHPAGRLAPEALTPLVPSPAVARNPASRWVHVIARIPRPLTVDVARERLRAAAQAVAQRFPVPTDDPSIAPTRRLTRGPFDVVRVRPLRDVLVAQTQTFAGASFAVATFLILLGALNLASLAAGRTLDRRRELAVRVAIGGSRAGVVRLLAAEHAVVLLIGGALGVLAARLMLHKAVALLPAGLLLLKAPAVDGRVIVFSVLALVAALAIVTLWSSRGTKHLALTPALAASSVTVRGKHTRSWLIGGQIALAVIMTLGGALLGSSLVRVAREDPGFHADHAARVRLSTPSTFRFDEMTTLVDAVGRMPGVRAVGGMDDMFLDRAMAGSGFTRPAGAAPTGDIEAIGVTSGYFSATGLVAIAGRLPTRDEFDRGQRVVVVSRRVAEGFWPGRPAVGQTLTRDGESFDVIGVVADIRHVAWDKASDGEIYSSLARRPELMNLLVAFDDAAGAPLPNVVKELSVRFPGVRIVRADMLADALGASVQLRRFQAWLFAAFGAAALIVVGVGVLGTIAMSVARRTREVGVRIALGATWTGVTGLIMREQMPIAGGGIVAGALISTWLVRFLDSYLYEMTPYDWVAWSVAIVAVVVVACVGALIPAVRASRIDPTLALRND